MTASDWINAAALLLGMAFIFLAGFLSGRLWQRGEHVRNVMTGAEPPPWDRGPDWLSSEDAQRILADIRADEELRRLVVRRGVYDQEREG